MQWNRVVAASIVALVFGGASAAQADDGDPLVLGQRNTAQSPTVLSAGSTEPDIRHSR